MNPSDTIPRYVCGCPVQYDAGQLIQRCPDHRSAGVRKSGVVFEGERPSRMGTLLRAAPDDDRLDYVARHSE